MGDSGTLGRPRWQDAAGGLFVACVAGFLVLPLPGAVLDLCQTLALGGAALLLAVVFDAPEPAALRRLPTGLLAFTLARLALSVAVTRAILTRGEAGEVVDGFARALAGDGVVAGLAMLATLVAIQMQVVARGAERVAQVAARFALDALPGRQLALEAELRTGTAGLGDPSAVRARREALSREASLVGALDGTMRFVRGESAASLLLLGVNLGGGLLVGLLSERQTFTAAGQHYARLAIGAGLVAQLSGLLAAAAAGLWVTRLAAGERPATRLPAGPASRLVRPAALAAVAALCLALATLPGSPPLPWLATGLALLAAAWLRARPAATNVAAMDVEAPPRLGLRLHPEARLALGDRSPEAVLEAVARRLALEDALVLPRVAIEDDPGLPAGGYTLTVGRATVARGRLEATLRFAAAPEGPAEHPESGVPGAWGAQEGLDSADYLAAHAFCTWRRTRGAVLDLDTLAARIAALEATAPALVAAVLPRVLDLPALARMLAALMAEGVPTADLRAIFEALSHLPPVAEDDERRLRGLRRGLAPVVTQCVAPDGRLDALCLDSHLEAQVAGAPSPEVVADLLAEAEQALVRHPRAALLVSPDARMGMRRLVEGRLPGLPVVTAEELLPQTRVTPVALLGARAGT